MIKHIIKTEAGIFAISSDNNLVPYDKLNDKELHSNVKVCSDGKVKVIFPDPKIHYGTDYKCFINEDEERKYVRDYDYYRRVYQKYLETVSVYRKDLPYTGDPIWSALELKIHETDKPFNFFHQDIAIVSAKRIHLPNLKEIRSLFILSSNIEKDSDLILPNIDRTDRYAVLEELRFDNCSIPFNGSHFLSKKNKFYNSKIRFSNIDFEVEIGGNRPHVELSKCEASADYIKYSTIDPIILRNNSTLTIDRLDWTSTRDMAPDISKGSTLHIKELFIGTDSFYSLDFTSGNIQIDKITKNDPSKKYTVKGHRGVNLVIEGKQIKSTTEI